MTHPIKRINLKSMPKTLVTEAKSIGPIVTTQLVVAALIIASVITTGANAIDSDIKAQDQVHLKHKIYLDENSNNDHDDDMTLEEYEASQQAKVIADANKRLARIKADAYGRRS